VPVEAEDTRPFFTDANELSDVETPAARLVFFAVLTNRRRNCSAFIWTGEYTRSYADVKPVTD